MLRLFQHNPNHEPLDQSHLVRLVMIYWFCIITGIVSLGFVFLPENWERWLDFLLINVGMNALHLVLLHFNKTRFASWSLPLSIWIMITIPCYTSGGILAPGILTQLGIVLIGGLLNGWRGGLAIGALSIFTDLFFVYAEMHGQLPPTSVVHSPLTRWIAAFIPFGTIMILQYHSSELLRLNITTLKEELGKRKAVENTLALTIVHLEERVKEFKTLYTISRFLENSAGSIADTCKKIVETMPAGWKYPKECGVCIHLNGTYFQSVNYKPSNFVQRITTHTKAETEISIEVVYTASFPIADEGPFLKEERNLLELIAEMLKTFVEKKESQSELKDYKHALDLSSAVCISDKDGTIRYANEKFCQMTKYSLKELQGQFFGIMMSKLHSIDYYNNLSESLSKGKPYLGEFCNETKDGQLYWVASSIVPFLDESGNITQYLSINQDITERKLVQEKIAKSEQLLSKLTSQVPGNTYMFEIDASGTPHILFANKGSDLYSLTNTSDTLIESPDNIQKIIHEDDRPNFLKAIQDANNTLAPISFQYRKIVNGEIRWRWMQAKAENNEAGKIIWYGSTSDITPLVDYISDIEQMLFDISHVLRRPIASILGLSGANMSEAIAANQWKELRAKIQVAANEMDAFVKELNTVYSEKKKHNQFQFDIDFKVNQRDRLFK